MLKNFLLTISLLAFIGVWQAVDAQTHFSEDFANGIPAGWTILDNDGLTPNASWPQTGLGGCGGYPLVQGWDGYCGNAMSVSWYSAPGQSDDWLITPAITIPAGVSNAFLRFTASTIRTQRQANYTDDYAVRIGLTTNPSDHVPNLLHNSNDPVFEEPVIDLSQWIGQTVYISWHNYANNEYALLVDNVEVVTKPDRDLTGETMDIFPYLANNGNPINVAGNFYNNGGTTVTSVDAEYTIDGGVPVTGTVTGLSIAPFSSGLITHPTQWSSPADGAHEVILSVTAVNGGADSNPADNELDKGVSLTSAPSQRTVLMETYTSSTCPPCRPGNTELENALENMGTPRVISIKFQCPFINAGDPYGTDEILGRWDYLSTEYGVGGIPHTWVDGGLESHWNPNVGSATIQSDLNNALGNDAFGDFSGTYMIDAAAQSVTIDGDFTPSTDMTGNERIHVAICEYETFRNAATNGEFEFFNVVKKMLPSENGTMLSAIPAGTAYSFDQVYTFNGSFRRPGATSGNNAGNRINHGSEHSVEEFTDLFVVAWVENEGEFYVLNSGRLTRTYATANDSEFDLATVSVSPNPTSDVANINLNLTEVASVKLEVVNVEGKVVLTKDAGTLATGNNSIELNVSDLPAGTYHVTALMEKGMITRPLMIVR